MEIHKENLNGARSTLEEFSKQCLEVEKLKADTDKEDVEHKANTSHQLQSQYTDYKYKYVNYQTRLLLLENLKSGKEMPLDDIGKELKKVAKSVREIKSDLLDAKIHREQQADDINTDYTEYENLTKECKQLMEELQTQGDDLNEDCSEGDNITKEMLEELKKAVSMEKEALQRDNSNKETKWYKALIEKLALLGGVVIRSLGERDIVLEFVDTDKAESGETLQATVRLSNAGAVTDIQLNHGSVEAEDIIAAALKHNDLQTFIVNMHARWSHHLPLLTEVERLRKMFVLDWVPEDNTITVLYGKEANLICVLYVEPYSRHVTLQSATGLPQSIHKDSLKPPVQRASLTQWLEHLRSRLEPQEPPE